MESKPIEGRKAAAGSGGLVLGFIAGLNTFGPGKGNIAPETTAEGLLGWVDNYCKANPLDSVTTAGIKLATQLKLRSVN